MSLDPDYTKEVKSQEEKHYPSEIIDLPSRGLVYSENNPLVSGEIELKYMTAKEEDILTSQNLIQKGVVIDKLLESLIVSDINYDDLILGDKNAIMVAARVLGYGKEYATEAQCPRCGNKERVDIDLTKMEDRDIDDKDYNRENRYEFTLPNSKRVITFKLLTHGDEKKIDEELRHIRAFNQKSKKKNVESKEFTTRLKYLIIALDGDSDKAKIRKFVDDMLAQDSLELRKHLKEFTPDVDLRFLFECSDCGGETVLAVPMTVEFFWPDAGI